MLIIKLHEEPNPGKNLSFRLSRRRKDVETLNGLKKHVKVKATLAMRLNLTTIITLQQ